MPEAQEEAFASIVADPAFWDLYIEFNGHLVAENEPVVTAGELIGAMAHLVIEAEFERYPMRSTAWH